jgi:hypothetical protein
MLHTQLAALALAAAAVIASGCGSSKNESTAASTSTPSTTATAATGAPLSLARWISEGNAICKNTEAKLATLNAHTQAQLANELPLAASYYTVQAEELAKLVPPKSMAHDWEQIIDDIHLFSEYTDKAAEYIKTAHKVDGPALAKATNLQRQVVAMVKHDGFTHCVRLG